MLRPEQPAVGFQSLRVEFFCHRVISQAGVNLGEIVAQRECERVVLAALTDVAFQGVGQVIAGLGEAALLQFEVAEVSEQLQRVGMVSSVFRRTSNVALKSSSARAYLPQLK